MGCQPTKIKSTDIQRRTELSQASPPLGQISCGTFSRSSYGIIQKKAVEFKLNKDGIQGMIGLKNLGNTCFLNSSLQCLVNTIPLMDYFLGFDWKREINLSNPIGTGGVIAEQFGYLVDTMWDSRVSSSISPTSFKRALGTFWPQFSGYDQHDAQELLAFLLDGLHEDLNRVVNKPYVEDVESDNREPAEVAVESWKAYLLRNRSIIVDIFQGQLRNVLCCLDCKYTSYKFDPFMYMSVPIPKGRQVHLHDCLDEFCRPEILSQGCQWNCPKCKVSRDAEKKMDVWIAPPVFIVHLKRFQDNSMGRRSKMDTLVTFPTRRLDLSKFMHSNQPGSHVYDLYAVSNHHGNMIQGHYTAYVKNRLNRKWCLYNDASVTAVKENDVCTNSAYVLFYHKVVRKDSGRHSADVMDLVSESSMSGDMLKRQSISGPENWPHVKDPTLPNNYGQTPIARDVVHKIVDEKSALRDTSSKESPKSYKLRCSRVIAIGDGNDEGGEISSSSGNHMSASAVDRSASSSEVQPVGSHTARLPSYVG